MSLYNKGSQWLLLMDVYIINIYVCKRCEDVLLVMQLGGRVFRNLVHIATENTVLGQEMMTCCSLLQWGSIRNSKLSRHLRA